MPPVVQVPDIHRVDLPEARQAIPHVHAYLRERILNGTLPSRAPVSGWRTTWPARHCGC